MYNVELNHNLLQKESDTLADPSVGVHKNSDNRSTKKSHFKDVEQHFLDHISNVLFGDSTRALSSFLGHKMEFSSPSILIKRKKDVNVGDEYPNDHICLAVDYTGDLEGKSVVFIKMSDATTFADLILGGDGQAPCERLSELEWSAVQEMMNQIIHISGQSMSEMFDCEISATTSTVEYIEINCLMNVYEKIEEEVFVEVSASFKVGDVMDSYITQVIPFCFASKLMERFYFRGNDLQEEKIMHHQINEIHQVEQITHTVNTNISTTAAVESHVCKQMKINETEDQAGNLDLLLDVPLTVNVELGKTKKKLGDILQFSVGDHIQLDRLIDEQVDICVHHKKVAQGNITTMNGKHAVKITQFMKHRET